MCGCEDGEPYEFYRHSTPKARKEHGCNECKRRIRPGQRYELIVGKFDGDFTVTRVCQRCQALSDAFAEVEGCHPPVGTLRDEIRECIYLNGLHREFGEAIRKRLGKEARRVAA